MVELHLPARLAFLRQAQFMEETRVLLRPKAVAFYEIVCA